ncbi:bifunctional DNA primase/polymerase [Gordonia polyisoprenivorans]|nr:bifunctional DNA primase/polymerase [Gordonia polyisoprenivorans]
MQPQHSAPRRSTTSLKVQGKKRFRIKTVASVPDVSGLDLRSAALAYAEAGWFVFPLSPGTKDQPVVKFSNESSRDREQIAAWWDENPDYGIALHVGRSGAVVFDLDEDSLDALPRELGEALRQGVVQKTRTGDGDRGHYDPSRDFRRAPLKGG